MADILYGRISRTPRRTEPWGSLRTLFREWGELRLTGKIVTFTDAAGYDAWADAQSENLCVVESGKGTLVHEGKEHPVREGHAFKAFRGQEVEVRPSGSLTVLSVQRPRSPCAGAFRVVDTAASEMKVYEYEALGQEIFTDEGSLGLLSFAFPIREIPFHIHPHSGRLIRTISGKGWTYCEPNVYEMDEDTFTLFPAGTVHTNGPVPGEVYKAYAFQLPYVPSNIDTENIAGSPRFVKYVGETPPRKLWKKKDDFLRMMDRLSK